MVTGYDVVRPGSGVPGTEQIADYEHATGMLREAGVAYTHAIMGYQTVNLGFGIEFILNDCGPGGWYDSGLPDRANLIGNIMEYFGKSPTLPGTEVEQPAAFATRLHQPHPNPFNPATTVSYSVGSPGRVTIRVYDVSGRVVRTLVDREHEPGEHAVQWDGVSGTGGRAASGVYFLQLEATPDDSGHGVRRVVPTDSQRRKLVLLK